MTSPSNRVVELRPSYGAAGIASALVLLLYVITLAPTTAMWDASEYITAAYTLGIPHPPGNPLFVLLGRVASLLPLGNVAYRVNLLAAVSSAAAAGIWFLVAERVLAQWIALRPVRLAGAGLAALLSATAFTVWNQSVVNEKVYTVSLAFFAIVSWLTVRWCDDPDGRKADRILVLIAYLIGLGYANHPAGFLVGPAVATAVLVRRPRTLLRWKLIAAAIVALAVGLTPFAVEPLRAAHHPTLNEGEPTGCTEKIGFSCTFSDTTVKRLMDNVNRVQYGKPNLSDRQAPFSAQLGMWWLYFKWQWLRDPHGAQSILQGALAVMFFALGIGGGVVHWKRDRASFWFFGPLVLTVTLALVYYMNFKYGASQAPGLAGVDREVRDRDYFYLWSYSAWSVWAALGLVGVWRALAESTKGTTRWRAFAPVMLFGALPLLGNWRAASRAGEWATREWAHDVLNSVEPYGVLITAGDNDTFPLWYAQDVEGIRRDVTVAVTSLLNTDWYARGLIRRPIVPYDEAAGPAVYRGRQWPMPTRPVLSLSNAELASVPEYLDVRQPVVFQQGAIRAVIDPRRLEFGVPLRSDLLVLQMLKDNIGVRPFYISRTTASYPETLGLDAYTLVQGLVAKVSTTPVVSSPDTVEVSGIGHVDVPRSMTLWRDVYRAPDAIIKRGDWVDRPSAGIPALYTSTGILLGAVLEQQGKADAARRVRERGVDIAEAAHVLEWFTGPAPSAPPPAAGSDAPKGATVPVRP
ncbi:MAG TPA: DUF2723 domain-containing protein [Gemmatimonadaceae bacterium]|nr:DUF2723 domain-containing protein [Gemmatimonadaceae bacterium]